VIDRASLAISVDIPLERALRPGAFTGRAHRARSP